MELPEGGKLKKLVVPPASPLRPIGTGQQPDSSAALHEALAHGNTVPFFPSIHADRIFRRLTDQRIAQQASWIAFAIAFHCL